MANLFGFASLGVSFVALIFTGLALALPNWSMLKTSITGVEVEVNYGIWRYCVTANAGYATSVCLDFLQSVGEQSGMNDKIRGTRAMVVLGLVFIVGAMVAMGIMLWISKEQKRFGFVGCVLAATGGLFLMVAMAIFEHDLRMENSKHGSAFVFDIVGWVLSWLSAALMCVATKRSDASANSFVNF